MTDRAPTRKPQTVLGTMTFAARVDVDEARRMIDYCLERGITHIDTANAYADGRAEELLGALLGSKRAELTLATKIGLPVAERPDESGLSPEAIKRAVASSLQRLCTDYVDLCYLHAPDPEVPLAESLGALQELVSDGLVRRGGVSNYAAWQICEARSICQEKGWEIPSVSQVQYNLVSRAIEEEYVAFAQAHAIETIVYNPLAGGLLTGKYESPDETPSAGRFADMPAYRDRYWSGPVFDMVAELRHVAEDCGITLVELALRWLAGRPFVDGVIVGATTLAQLEENVEALAMGSLTADAESRCNELWASLRGPFPRYWR